MFALTFDWNIVTSWLSSPMVVFWWVRASDLVGFTLLLYYTLFQPYLIAISGARKPIQSATRPYLLSAVRTRYLESRQPSLNETEYIDYGPSAFHLSSLSPTALASPDWPLSRIILWNRKQIFEQWKLSREENPDIHTKLTRQHSEVVIGLIYPKLSNCLCPTTYNGAKTFYAVSAIRGVIGPAKWLGSESPTTSFSGFPSLSPVNFLVLNHLLSLIYQHPLLNHRPISFYYLAKKYPETHPYTRPTTMMPPADPFIFSSWVFVGFFITYYFRKYHSTWWFKFITSPPRL
ncbi:hypothetical protein BC938DRAFT_482783 [Jimgerdemannia flammicorona]|uniref:Uncharacterized protein n=1 Tax=Jimgerdemannia flammicorona TaxID=994334 RepID=A0A433QW44_9FUNG|nr:hypothetical protein BC938DRAFT_482783 [Jimgerdemannia flammicorona]